MLSMEKSEAIDNLSLTFATTLAETEIGKESKGAGQHVWPMPKFHPARAETYTASHLLPRLYRSLTELRDRGYSDQEIAQLFKNPSRIAQLVWLFTASKIVPLGKEELTNLAFDIVKMISTYRDDTFCEEGKNIIWSEDKVEDSLGKANNLESSEESKKVLGKLNGVAWLLCELLYFDFHGAGHEFHGPYELDDNKILVVREYYDLRPEHWNFTSQLSFDRILTLEIYDNCEIEFDFFNRTRWTEPISQYLENFSVFVDGSPVNELEEVNTVVDQLEKVLREGSKEAKGRDKKELIKKFSESYFFIIKPLQEELGRDWWPPKSLYQEVEERKRKDTVEKTLSALEETEGKSKKEFIQIMKEVIDPRK